MRPKLRSGRTTPLNAVAYTALYFFFSCSQDENVGASLPPEANMRLIVFVGALVGLSLLALQGLVGARNSHVRQAPPSFESTEVKELHDAQRGCQLRPSGHSLCL